VGRNGARAPESAPRVQTTDRVQITTATVDGCTQRLGRALAMDPELLMLDEPVAGMNLEETEDMARFVLDVQDELGIAIILVEHDMGLVMDIADRVLVVDCGKPIAIGTPDAIQHNSNVIKAYLGEEVETV
jgi:branched-chain amino acid transport system ATP-binding protein